MKIRSFENFAIYLLFLFEKQDLTGYIFKKSYNSSSLMFHYSQGKSCWYTCTHYWCSNPDNRVSGGNKRPLKERNKIINILVLQKYLRICHLSRRTGSFLKNLKLKLKNLVKRQINIWILHRNLTIRSF